MKRFLYILACLLLSISVKAQLIYNEEGEVVPFSMSEKYKNMIDTSKVNACTLKSYNNDLLYISYNKNFVSAFGDEIVAGFPIDTLINLKIKATKYKIAEGTLWLYKIESKTADLLGIEINHLEFPEGAYLCIFPSERNIELRGKRVYLKKDIKDPNFFRYQLGNQLFIEYFEPKGVKPSSSLLISRISYGFPFSGNKRH